MDRLTKITCKYEYDMYAHKLQGLENLEENIGLDFPSIFSGISGGVFFKNILTGEIKFYDRVSLHYNNGWAFDIMGVDYYLCDYKKLWALNKEDLENEQSRDLRSH